MALIPFKASAEQWRPLFQKYGSDLPQDFLVAWLHNESGGNPCSLGIPNVEAGIFQTYHPADDKYGATFSQLRAGCSGSTLVNPSLVDRDLQVRSGLNYVRGKIAAAQTHMFAAGVNWPMSSPDFWIAVKQEHALPCVMGDLLPRVTSRFGPPPDWDTFKRQALSLSPTEMGSGCAGFARSPSLHGLQNRIADTMRNAEETGKFGGGVRAEIGKLGSMGPFLLLGGAATLLGVMLWRR